MALSMALFINSPLASFWAILETLMDIFVYSKSEIFSIIEAISNKELIANPTLLSITNFASAAYFHIKTGRPDTR